MMTCTKEGGRKKSRETVRLGQVGGTADGALQLVRLVASHLQEVDQGVSRLEQ